MSKNIILKRESGKWVIIFGKYKEECLKNVPTHYLQWILDTIEDLSIKEFNLIRSTIGGRRGQMSKYQREKKYR